MPALADRVACSLTLGQKMNELATTVSGLEVVVLYTMIIAVGVSPLADLLTKSYGLLGMKILVIGAGFILRESVLPIWFLSAILGLSIVSFIRATAWFRNLKGNT